MVTVADTNPTLRQLQLANRLRDLRQESGLSVAEVAEQVLLSPAQVSRIENAKRTASPRDVRALCKLYGVPEEDLLELAKEARQPVWWQNYDDRDFRQMIGLESVASEITEYETTTIPGLLQTEAYARAILKGYLPGIDAEVLEQRIQARVKRQELLRRIHPPKYWVLLDESALHRHVGGRRAMQEQLESLGELAERPNINILVLPFTVGAHMGFDMAFRMLEFPETVKIFDTLFVEDALGHAYTQDYGAGKVRVARYREIIDHLRATAANPADSRAIILRMAERFGQGDAHTTR